MMHMFGIICRRLELTVPFIQIAHVFVCLDSINPHSLKIPKKNQLTGYFLLVTNFVSKDGIIGIINKKDFYERDETKNGRFRSCNKARQYEKYSAHRRHRRLCTIQRVLRTCRRERGGRFGRAEISSDTNRQQHID